VNWKMLRYKYRTYGSWYIIEEQICVFRDRIKLILATIPVLWKFHADFESMDAIQELEHRLVRLQKVLENDQWHEGSKEQAQDIQTFLDLLDTHRNATERVDRHPYVEKWLAMDFSDPRRTDRTDEESELISQWCEEVQKLEEDSWNQAWELFRKEARGWWC